MNGLLLIALLACPPFADNPLAEKIRGALAQTVTCDAEYKPGQSGLTWDVYDRRTRAYQEKFQAIRELQRQVERMKDPKAAELLAAQGKALQKEQNDLTQLIEAETTPALLAVFSKPDAVYMHSFNPHETRQTSKDGGEGVRIVFERIVDGRLISAITFWRYNKATKDLEMITGPDSVRVRTEFEAPKSRFGFRVAGLSYTTTVKDGKITGIRPGDYLDTNGMPNSKTAPSQAAVGGCQGCHSSGLRKNITFEQTRAPVTDGWGYKEFIEHLPEAERPAMERRLANPARTMMPPGIVDALKARCAARRS